MTRQFFQFEYEVFASLEELDPADAVLLQVAQQAIGNAYAPYSGFRVGAAARMDDGQLISGSNQENASFPAGICAERVLLSAVSAIYSGASIQTIALSYSGDFTPSDHPITPCGICRQSLKEYEDRQERPIRLVLGGMTGEVFIVSTTVNLLPFSFSGSVLGKH